MEAKEICMNCKAHCCSIGGPLLTENEREIILGAGHPDKFVRRGEFYTIQQGMAGHCAYLNADFSCSIYNERPIVCKTWPFMVVLNDGKRQYIRGADCPLEPTLSIEKELQARSDLEKLSESHIRALEDWSNQTGYKSK